MGQMSELIKEEVKTREKWGRRESICTKQTGQGKRHFFSLPSLAMLRPVRYRLTICLAINQWLIVMFLRDPPVTGPFLAFGLSRWRG